MKLRKERRSHMSNSIENLLDGYVIELQNIYGRHLQSVILYGSYARGDFTKDSDVDIMILLNLTEEEIKEYRHQLSEHTYDYYMTYNLDIKPIAKSDINDAKILLDAGEYRSSNNRAYYGIYHAISAVHALEGNAYKKHKDALANFNKEYVKTEIFPRNIGRRISEAEEQIATAVELLELVTDYCKERF